MRSRPASIGALAILVLASCVTIPPAFEPEVASPDEIESGYTPEVRSELSDSLVAPGFDGDDEPPPSSEPCPTIIALDPPSPPQQPAAQAVVPEEPIPPEPSGPIDFDAFEAPSPEHADDAFARLSPPVPSPPPIVSGVLSPAREGLPGTGQAPSAGEVTTAAGPGTSPEPESKASPAPAAAAATTVALVAAPRPEEGPSIVELPPIAIRLSKTGITVPVTLTGFGWIYLADPGAEGFVFVGREFTDTASVFGFRVDRPGDYSLRFQRQDNEAGRFEAVTVEILGDDARERTESVASESGAESTPSVPIDTDRTTMIDATTIVARVESEEAHLLYRETLERLTGDDGTYPYGPVVSALLEYAIPRGPAEYLELADALETGGFEAEAVATWVATIERYGRAPGVDVAYFRLARVFESDSPLRDERRALGYYRKITDDFPLSGYYEEAEARIRHIERHFIDIR